MGTPTFFKISTLPVLPQADNPRGDAKVWGSFFRLSRFYGVKFPRLMPLIKRLIRFKPNLFFELLFLASYGWCFLMSENLGPAEMLSVGFRNVRGFFFSGKGAH